MAGYKRCQHSGIHNAHTLGKIKHKLSEDLTIAPLQRFSCCKRSSSKDIERKQISGSTQGLKICYKEANYWR